jgi:hypothetical protein
MSTHENPRDRGGTAQRQMSVRLDADLFDLLSHDAVANGRTLAQSLRWHARRSLEQETAAA